MKLRGVVTAVSLGSSILGIPPGEKKEFLQHPGGTKIRLINPDRTSTNQERCTGRLLAASPIWALPRRLNPIR
jgi:hypothetical protein